MTALAGVFSPDASPLVIASEVTRQTSQRARGADRAESWSAPHAVLHVARYDWECVDELAGETLVAARDDIAVISDASLYHRQDLYAKLARAGEQPRTASAAEVILAAYRAFGLDCARHLEGDFAFVLWDARERLALLARDFVGRRPLFHAMSRRGHLIVASSAKSIAAHPDVSAPISHIMVAAAVSGLLGGSNYTGFEGIEAVHAGSTLVWNPERGLRHHATWEAPTFSFQRRKGDDTREAALELRELLTAAAATRITPSMTSVWLSGGADSPAVFASAQTAATNVSDRAATVVPVSISFPEGDMARENDHITAIAARWQSSVHWVDSESMMIFERLEERARARDDPYAHTHEAMNRALSRGTVSTGARVGFDGYGGDQLFYVSWSILADLFAMGRWIALAHALRQLGIRDGRAMIRWSVIPLLPARLTTILGKVRRRPFASPGLQALAPWVTPRLARDPDLLAKAHLEPPRRLGERRSTHESRFYITSPYFPRAVSWAAGFALEEGVEMRSPLLDERVVRFAASRPVVERSPVEGGKHLLRQAMRGLVPDSVLAPRPTKTGIPRGYFHRQMHAESGTQFARTFDQPGATVALADLGIIDPRLVREGLAEYLRSSDHLTGIQLFLTLQAELWLRSLRS